MLVGKGFEIFPEVSVTKVTFVSQIFYIQKKNQKSQNLWELIDQFTNAIQYNIRFDNVGYLAIFYEVRVTCYNFCLSTFSPSIDVVHLATKRLNTETV